MSELPLYYMAPIENAAYIRVFGIFSYNAIRSHPILSAALEERRVQSIADPWVNWRRHCKQVGGRSLHDYVPFYWCTHTPMQYVDTIKNNILPQGLLVFLVCDANEILKLRGVWTTDGNAASNETEFFEGSAGFDCLDWNILGMQDCWSKEWKRRKMAEVLVPEHVPVKLVKRAIVERAGSRETLNDMTREIAAKFGRSHENACPIEVSREPYYDT
jgi:hypothetical protein